MAESDAKSLEAQEKKELVEKEETTVPTRTYVPNTDIYETPAALIVVVEMPGVEKDLIDIRLEKDVLRISGRIDFDTYADMQPLYAEYNVGHYDRRFSLSSKIDQDKIAAEINDGVLTLTLPKAEEAMPRKIAIT